MLLKHVFAVDVTICVTCGGPMRLLSIATTPVKRVTPRSRAASGWRPATGSHRAQVSVQARRYDDVVARVHYDHTPTPT
jgi:hypothetical protein